MDKYDTIISITTPSAKTTKMPPTAMKFINLFQKRFFPFVVVSFMATSIAKGLILIS